MPRGHSVRSGPKYIFVGRLAWAVWRDVGVWWLCNASCVVAMTPDKYYQEHRGTYDPEGQPCSQYRVSNDGE